MGLGVLRRSLIRRQSPYNAPLLAVRCHGRGTVAQIVPQWLREDLAGASGKNPRAGLSGVPLNAQRSARMPHESVAVCIVCAGNKSDEALS